jgi:hypothetical protein
VGNPTQPQKEEILSFVATWMDLEIIMLNEISQEQKDKYHMISSTCGIVKAELISTINKSDY